MTPAPLFVITGTSGTGKSALLEALQQRGHLCFEEPVRRLLQDQLAIDGPALPAKDPLLFVRTLQQMFERDLILAQASGRPAFFDRGWPDSLAYARRFGVESERLAQSTPCNYHPTVFVTPPWPEIFRHDTYRQGSFEMYTAFHAQLIEAYQAAGYTLCELPRVSVTERVTLIESYLPQAYQGQRSST